MKWRVESREQSFIVDLPDIIIDRERFQLGIGKDRFLATWNRQEQVLFLSPEENPEFEQVLSLRGAQIVSFADEPDTHVQLELRPCGGIPVQAYSGQAEIHLEGLKSRKSEGAAKGVTVRSPMTGKVLRLVVKEGEEVQKGQLLCVVEAMKMENQITSPGAGTVADLKIAEGDQIGANSKLLTIKA